MAAMWITATVAMGIVTVALWAGAWTERDWRFTVGALAMQGLMRPVSRQAFLHVVVLRNM